MFMFFMRQVSTKCYSGDQIKVDEMGGTCSKYGAKDKGMQVFFLWGKLRVGSGFEYLDVNRKTVLKYTLKTYLDG